MSITCKFEFSKTSNIYYSGEEIVGSLTVCSVKKCQTEEIILEFHGQSKVQWWELDKSEEYLMHHNDISTIEMSKKIINSQLQKHVCVQLKLASTNVKELQPHVEYTFKFCFSIPEQAPATFYCTYGQTEYGLRLTVERRKKANKEFLQGIVVKKKLDLIQDIKLKKPYAVCQHNEFGQIDLHIPCSGFTPGQQIPYYLKYQTTQINCKILLQLNCYITCHTKGNCCKYKQIKEIINYKKHVLTENSSHINIPLQCHISSRNDPDLILNIAYSLEAFLINNNRRVLLSASIPLIIGTSPCYLFDEEFQGYMCYNNMGSSLTELCDPVNMVPFF